MPQTGPKTPDGKKRSSRNAVKHGLGAKAPVLRLLESEADWKRHLDGIIESLEPEGYLEEEMPARVAGLLWRLRRVNIYETEHISWSMDRIGADHDTTQHIMKIYGMPEEELTIEKIDSMVGTRMLPSLVADTVMRYEAHLHRQYPTAGSGQASRGCTSWRRCRPAAAASARRWRASISPARRRRERAALARQATLCQRSPLRLLRAQGRLSATAGMTLGSGRRGSSGRLVEP